MKSIIRNFTTAFFAGFISTVLLLIYVFVYKVGQDNFWVFIAMLVMGICSILGFVGLLILSFFSNIFNWTEEIEWMHSFWYWSIIGTLLVISFDYKSMFAEHFTISRSNIISNNH